MQSGFSSREEAISRLGAKALGRHKTMADAYKKSLDKYLYLTDLLPQQKDDISRLDILKQLKELLDKVFLKKKREAKGQVYS